MKPGRSLIPTFAALPMLMCSTLATLALSPVAVSQAPVGNSTLQLAHGFHCRPMLGWDSRAGVYHLHRHAGICQDYKRCMRVMYRCDFRNGKGWEPWSYERWGFDNYRFDKCMLDAGCY